MKEEQAIRPIFLTIFYFASIAGFQIPFELETRKRNFKIQFMLKIFKKTWRILITAVHTFCFTIVAIYYNLYFASLANRVGFLLSCFIGYAYMWIFLIKRNKIMNSIDKISHLYSALRCDDSHRRSFVKIYFIMSCLYVVGIFGGLVLYFCILNYDSVSKNVKSYIPFSENSVYFNYYNWLVLLSPAFSNSMSIYNKYVILSLCSECYWYSGEILVHYKKILKEEIKNEVFAAINVTEKMRILKNIVFSVKEVDEVFGVFSLMIYVEVFNNIVGFLSIVLSKDERFQSLIMYMMAGSVFYTTILMLFYLSLCGGKVSNEYEALKEYIINLLGCVINQSPRIITLQKIELFCDFIYHANLEVTILGFHPINTRIILYLTGITVTYSILWYQIGALENS